MILTPWTPVTLVMGGKEFSRKAANNVVDVATTLKSWTRMYAELHKFAITCCSI